MPYYFAPLEPSGALIRGVRLKRPVGADSPSQRNWLILGDQALMWASDPIADARLQKIADDKQETLAAATRSILGNVAKDREFRGTQRIDDSIADLLLTPPAGAKWGALRPSKRYLRYEIILGPNKSRELFWSRAAQIGKNTKTYVDTFNRANGNLDGSTSSDSQFTWTEGTGTNWTITSNQAACNNIADGTQHRAYTSADCDTDDEYAECTVATYTRATNSYLAFWISCCNDAADSVGYSLIQYAFGNVTAERILARVSDSATLDSDTTLATTGARRIEVDGSTIRGFFGGVEVLTATDTTETGGAGNRRASITAEADTVSTNDLVIDSFGYGDIATGGQTYSQTLSDNLSVQDATAAYTLRNRQAESVSQVSDSAVYGAVRNARLESAITDIFDELRSYYVRGSVAGSTVLATDDFIQFYRRTRMAESGIEVVDETVYQIIGQTIFNIILSDAINVTDSSVWWLRFNRGLDDSIQISDEGVIRLILRRIAGDDISITDEALAVLIGQNVFEKVLTDGLLLSDQAVVSTFRNRLLESTAAVTDATSRALTLIRELLDGLQVTDEPLTALSRFLTMDDAIVVSDDLQKIYIADQVFSPRLVVGVDQPKILVGEDQPFINLGGYAH